MDHSKTPGEGLTSAHLVKVSHSRMLPKDAEGQGIPLKTPDCTVIEKKVAGTGPALKGDAAGMPTTRESPAVSIVVPKTCLGGDPWATRTIGRHWKRKDSMSAVAHACLGKDPSSVSGTSPAGGLLLSRSSAGQD